MSSGINFSGRSIFYTQEEIDTVVDAMKNADPLTQGKYQKEFEGKLSDYLGAEYCFAVNNGTNALEIAAQLCCFEDGDEIVAPSHTFTSSVYPFVKNGASVVWADIDPITRVVTAETIEKRITNKTKVILVVHLYGYLTDMPAIMDLAKKHNLLVIEDAAQAIGTDIEGKKAGSFGDMGMISLHSHKNMTTLGEGGVLIVKEEKYAELIPKLRHNGHCNFGFNRDDYWIPAMGNVDFPELNGRKLWPNNYCMGEIECAVGVKLLDRIDEINSQKRARAIHFIDSLSAFPELRFHRVNTYRHNYHLLVAESLNGNRDEFIRTMYNKKGIKCVVQYYPLNRYDFYKRLGFEKAGCPNADFFYDNMISFPFHHSLTDGELNYMLKSTKEVLKGQAR